MNKMLSRKKGLHVVTYADDVAVSVRGKFPNTLVNLMRTIINDIDRWAVSCGLNLNASKRQLVLFTRKYSTPEIMAPVLNGSRLTIGDKASYLGLILYRKLSRNKTYTLYNNGKETREAYRMLTKSSQYMHQWSS